MSEKRHTMLRKFFNFPGGLFLSEHEEEHIVNPVRQAGIPDELVYPLTQHNGQTARAIVSSGDRVLKGQLIAMPRNEKSTPIHAASSGIVNAITEHAFAHESGLSTPSIIIKTDKLEQWVSNRKAIKDEYNEVPPAKLREVIHDAGIVGMGGAGFPSGLKLQAGESHVINTLIINGAECEPYVTCDDMLMRERAQEIIKGAQIIMHAIQSPKCIIAIEDNKPEAQQSIQELLDQLYIDNIQISIIPTIYPAGGEKQLIRLVTGLEIGMREMPFHYGIVCHNVATAAAIYRAIYHAEPLISRIISVTGAVPNAGNLDTLIGTPVSDLISQCGGKPEKLDQVIIGGPMMGTAVNDVSIPVMKTSFCVIARSEKAMPSFSKRHKEHACIRCGNCAQSCPVNLLPQQLYWYAKSNQLEKAEDYNLFDCIDCGCCDYVCPSHIPLVQYFRFAKNELRARQREQQHAAIARQRYEFRQFRLERNEHERTLRHKKKIADLAAGKHKTARTEAPPGPPDSTT